MPRLRIDDSYLGICCAVRGYKLAMSEYINRGASTYLLHIKIA